MATAYFEPDLFRFLKETSMRTSARSASTSTLTRGPRAGALKQVRDHIVERPKDWKAVVSARIEIIGDSLKRPPAGYDAEHPFVEDLKRKEFAVLIQFTDRQVLAPGFMDRYLKACQSAGPLVRFLTKAVGLPA